MVKISQIHYHDETMFNIVESCGSNRVVAFIIH
ncbi:hypothetical protein LINPERHAP1_LOCUS4834 [Linum perenne]